VVAREGFESVLLTAMILQFLPRRLHWQFHINLSVCWSVFLLLGLTTVVQFREILEPWQPVLSIITGLVLLYIFTTSRTVYQHAQEHVKEIDKTTLLRTHATVALIILREAGESTMFLASNFYRSLQGTAVGIVCGLMVLWSVMSVATFLGQRVANKLVFKVIGFSLLFMGIYFILDGIQDLRW
jgi:small neutral amino acid transporter SnatA (MarC family)